MSEEVNIFNEKSYREQFCKNTGHSMSCVNDTITDMANLFAKTCHCFNAPVEEIFNMIEVEQFDKHLRMILSIKECNCITKH